VAEDGNRRKEEKADEPTNSIFSPRLVERRILGPMEWKGKKKKRVGDDLILSDRLCSYRFQSRQMISRERGGGKKDKARS
jgi:hypothetical protein